MHFVLLSFFEIIKLNVHTLSDKNLFLSLEGKYGKQLRLDEYKRTARQVPTVFDKYNVVRIMFVFVKNVGSLAYFKEVAVAGI